MSCLALGPHAIKRRRIRQPRRDPVRHHYEGAGKGPAVGHKISHAHNVSSRRWLPNLVNMRALVNGRAQRLRVCTRCLKAGKVTKVV